MRMREHVAIERGRKDNRAGMPRPLAKAKGVLRPVPWTNSDEGWGLLHYARAEKAEKKSLCLVCGKKVDQGVILATKKDCSVRADFDDLRYAADNGPLHARCGKITVAHCQHVRDQLRTGEMFMIPYCRQMT